MIHLNEGALMRRVFLLIGAVVLMLSLGACMCQPWLCGPGGPDGMTGIGGAGGPGGRP